MTRIPLVLLALGIIACSDDTSVMAPDQPALASNDTLSTSTLELSFDTRGLSARTALSGGAATVFDATVEAFSLAAPNLQALSLARHETGDAEFEVEFVPSPAAANAGLGPVFDNVSCEACHEGDGRGRPPASGEPFSSLLFRASVAGTGPHNGPVAVPGFGTQLQLRAVPDFTPEVYAGVSYTDSAGSFTDGTAYHLQVPHYTISNGYAALPAGVLLSPRVAPFVFGLGLLEAVPEADVLALASKKVHTFKVSGRPNYVWDEVLQRTALGRFGWKANVPNLVQQTAGAYNGDMGITSPLFSAESCEGEYAGCTAHPPEVDDQTVQDVAFYARTLGVPARRNLSEPLTRQGESEFYAAGCDDCHAPTLRTGSLAGIPEVSNQVIHPYTDLLLHDLGPALADQRPDFQASGSEWRTPPLWGIGLVETVNGHTNFLHDGRARSLLEAVLWHGGEAAASQDRVLGMSAQQRAALLAFLGSL
ncbi:MAG TPA: di-heme oxidoredictase family protein [Gemmatimonadales bacterium]|nr:di-heme oxidoredictase family protein [Gemmatimonadales bacterium]